MYAFHTTCVLISCLAALSSFGVTVSSRCRLQKRTYNEVLFKVHILPYQSPVFIFSVLGKSNGRTKGDICDCHMPIEILAWLGMKGHRILQRNFICIGGVPAYSRLSNRGSLDTNGARLWCYWPNPS